MRAERRCRRGEDTWGPAGGEFAVMNTVTLLTGGLKAEPTQSSRRGRQKEAGKHQHIGSNLNVTCFQWRHLCSTQHNPALTIRILNTLYHLPRGSSENPYKARTRWRLKTKKWISKNSGVLTLSGAIHRWGCRKDNGRGQWHAQGTRVSGPRCSFRN